MKRWYSFYADKFRDEKLVRCVQELYNSGFKIDSNDIISFPELLPWGHNLDIVRLSDTLSEAVFYIKKTIQEITQLNNTLAVILLIYCFESAQLFYLEKRLSILTGRRSAVRLEICLNYEGITLAMMFIFSCEDRSIIKEA